ncbi:MAG: hypothetical protein Q4G68_12790, partial [Planctomycetia bacterium]|nr:hypothetical protein [Planctomycetia bacterium]
MAEKRSRHEARKAIILFLALVGTIFFVAPAQGQPPAVPSTAPAPIAASPASPPTASIPEATGQAPTTAEEQLFTALIKVPESGTSSIEGKVLPLNEFLEASGNPQDRYRRAYSYWMVVEKLALYNVYLSHAQDIDMCSAQRQNRGMSVGSQAFWHAAQVLAVQRVKTAELEFTSAQYRFLQSYYNFSGQLGQSQYFAQKDPESRQAILANLLWIPAEIPTTKPYNTKAEAINQVRPLSGPARTLALTVPLQAEVVQLRMSEANKSYEGLVSLFTSQNAPDDQLEEALERTTEAKVAMVEAVIKYNQMIAAYVAETVAVRTQGNVLLGTYNIPAKPELATKTALADSGRGRRGSRIAGRTTFAPKSNPELTGAKSPAPGMNSSGPGSPATIPPLNTTAPVGPTPAGARGDWNRAGVPSRPESTSGTAPASTPFIPANPLPAIPSGNPSPVPTAPEFPIIRGQMPAAATPEPAPASENAFPSYSMPDLPELNPPADTSAPAQTSAAPAPSAAAPTAIPPSPPPAPNPTATPPANNTPGKNPPGKKLAVNPGPAAP